jgi:hypothetical protein
MNYSIVDICWIFNVAFSLYKFNFSSSNILFIRIFKNNKSSAYKKNVISHGELILGSCMTSKISIFYCPFILKYEIKTLM